MAPLFPLILRRRNSGNTSNKSKKMSSPPYGRFRPTLTIKISSWINIYFNINPRGYISLLWFTQNYLQSHRRLKVAFYESTSAQRSDIQTPLRSLVFSTFHLTSPSFCFDSAKIKYYTIVPILGHILRLCQRCIPTGQRSATEEREMV